MIIIIMTIESIQNELSYFSTDFIQISYEFMIKQIKETKETKENDEFKYQHEFD